MRTVAGIRAFAALSVCFVSISIGSIAPKPSFSEAERQGVIDFWSSKAQYSTAPAGSKGAEWCVRLTPSGSKWIREVYRQFQTGKVIPTQDPNGNTPQQRAWTAWIDRQVERDWTAAESIAAKLNVDAPQSPETGGHETRSTTLERKTGEDKIGREPEPAPIPQSDPCPADLVAILGQPPKFAAPVHPMRHEITFPDGTRLTYVDNVKVRPKYAYYRFADGVNSEGVNIKKLSDSELEGLIKDAGITTSEERVMKAVSMLEGGFDSINTYDTGYVSVGFIQFACLADGKGSLGEMMRHYKSTNPAGFQADFRNYGIDVDGDSLVAIDLETGAERSGPEAALQIIHDKRLIAVFQRAGLKSKAFRVAQLQAAKNQFYPANEKVTVNLGGTDYCVKVCDVCRTEAGMATLMDRKVNTGKMNGLKEVIERYADQFGISDPSGLPDIEYLVTRAMTYRQDYLLMSSLSKPRDNTTQLSRRGTRNSRTNDPASGGGKKKQA